MFLRKIFSFLIWNVTLLRVGQLWLSTTLYNSSFQMTDIGTGLVWDDVYKALEPHGVNVMG